MKKGKDHAQTEKKNITERFLNLSSCILEPGQKEAFGGLYCSLQVPERRCRQVGFGLFSEVTSYRVRGDGLKLFWNVCLDGV